MSVECVIAGNSAVIYVAVRKQKYRNVTNCYVINLAIADLLFLSLSIPYTTHLGLINSYLFADVVCQIYTYLTYVGYHHDVDECVSNDRMLSSFKVFLLSTCNTLAAMSIDRYYYIVLPRAKLRWRTPRNAFFICMIIWASE